jgi:hypothetical protein
MDVVAALRRYLCPSENTSALAGRRYCPKHPSSGAITVFPQGEEAYQLCTECLKVQAAEARKRVGR